MKWSWSLRLKASNVAKCHKVIDRFTEMIGCPAIRLDLYPVKKYTEADREQFPDIDENDINDLTRFVADIEYGLPEASWADLVYLCLCKASMVCDCWDYLRGKPDRWLSAGSPLIKDSGIHYATWMLTRPEGLE
jgi:hypothetical protein